MYMQLCRGVPDGAKSTTACFMVLHTKLFNLAISTPTTKPPNLIPHPIFRLYGIYFAIHSSLFKLLTNITVFFTCCEGSCIHWVSREHSTSTEPSLGDSETVVYAFLQSIKYVLLMMSIQHALINIGPTCPPI